MADPARRTIVVGGGVAGLAAAEALHRNGAPLLLLEASDRWGGVTRTDREGGFLLEAGPDAILAQKPEGLALCRALGLGARLIPTSHDHRAVFILRRGRLHALPEGMVLTIPTRFLPFATTRLFSWRGKLRMALDALIPRKRGGADESIAAFTKRRLGQEALELIGEPLLAGIHSGDPERLSMRATFPRLLDLEARHGSLIRGMIASRAASRGPRAASAMFYTLQDGLQELIDTLVARIPETSRRLRVRALSIARTQEGYEVVTDAGERLAATSVILALPCFASGAVLASLAPEISESLRAVPYVSTAVVFLGLRREHVGHPLDGYGMLVPSSESLRMTACTFFSTKYAGRAPDGHVLLRGFFGGARDSKILDLTDRDLVALARKELTRVLDIRGPSVLSRVYRWPASTPQMEVGHLERVAGIERRLREHRGLYLTGAGLRSTGIPDGVADATRAASSALEHEARAGR